MRRGFTLAVARVSFEETVSRMSVSHSRLEIRFRSNEGVWVRLNGQRPRPPSLTQPPRARQAGTPLMSPRRAARPHPYFRAASSRGHPRTTRGYPRPGGNVTKKGRGYPREYYVPDPPTGISPAAGDIPGRVGDIPGRSGISPAASGMSPTSGDIPGLWRGASPTGSGTSPALRGMPRPRLGRWCRTHNPHVCATSRAQNRLNSM